MSLKPWKTLRSKTIVDDRWITIRADTCENEAGIQIDPYYVLDPGEWVHVVAFNESQDVLLIRQYRHALGEVCIELPCGCVDQGEEPLSAMKRELLEETGCEAKRWEALPKMAANAARFSTWVYPYIALGVKEIQAQQLDDVEEIEFGFYPALKVLEMIQQGEIVQSLHIASILLAFRQLKLPR